MKDNFTRPMTVGAILIGAGLALCLISLALFVFSDKCVPGDTQVCTWHSPYTDKKEIGKQICSSDGWWMGCHSFCENNKNED